MNKKLAKSGINLLRRATEIVKLAEGLVEDMAGLNKDQADAVYRLGAAAYELQTMALKSCDNVPIELLAGEI